MPDPIHSLMDLATSHWKSAALSAGVEVGVFELLARRPNLTTQQIASALSTAPLHTAALLDALVTLDVLERDASGYRIASPCVALLDPASEQSLLRALKFNAMGFGLWAKLGTTVKTGTLAIQSTGSLVRLQRRSDMTTGAWQSPWTCPVSRTTPAPGSG